MNSETVPLRLFVVLSACALLCACPTGSTPHPDGGNDDDGGLIVTDYPVISVSGTTVFHPAAVIWMADAGITPPPLTGLTVRVEEPLKAAQNDPGGVFGSQVVAADGAFSASDVDTSYILVGLAAGFRDTADAGVARGASTIYDVLREGKVPQVNISGAVAHALPVSFVTQLSQVIGSAAIQTASGGLGSTLQGTGFSLIRVVNAQGAPVAGVRVQFVCGTGCVTVTGGQFFYPNEALTSVSPHTNTSAATSANGLVIYVGNNTAPHQVNLTIEGHGEYPQTSAGAAPNAALTVTLSPR